MTYDYFSMNSEYVDYIFRYWNNYNSSSSSGESRNNSSGPNFDPNSNFNNNQSLETSRGVNLNETSRGSSQSTYTNDYSNSNNNTSPQVSSNQVNDARQTSYNDTPNSIPSHLSISQDNRGNITARLTINQSRADQLASDGRAMESSSSNAVHVPFHRYSRSMEDSNASYKDRFRARAGDGVEEVVRNTTGVGFMKQVGYNMTAVNAIRSLGGPWAKEVYFSELTQVCKEQTPELPMVFLGLLNLMRQDTQKKKGSLSMNGRVLPIGMIAQPGIGEEHSSNWFTLHDNLMDKLSILFFIAIFVYFMIYLSKWIYNYYNSVSTNSNLIIKSINGFRIRRICVFVVTILLIFISTYNLWNDFYISKESRVACSESVTAFMNRNRFFLEYYYVDNVPVSFIKTMVVSLIGCFIAYYRYFNITKNISFSKIKKLIINVSVIIIIQFNAAIVQKYLNLGGSFTGSISIIELFESWNNSANLMIISCFTGVMNVFFIYVITKMANNKDFIKYKYIDIDLCKIYLNIFTIISIQNYVQGLMYITVHPVPEYFTNLFIPFL